MQSEPTARHPVLDGDTVELLDAIHDALAIPQPASIIHQITYANVVADRAMRVIEMLDRVLGRGILDPSPDLAGEADRLRSEMGRHPTNAYVHAPAPPARAG